MELVCVFSLFKSFQTSFQKVLRLMRNLQFVIKTIYTNICLTVLSNEVKNVF